MRPERSEEVPGEAQRDSAVKLDRDSKYTPTPLIPILMGTDPIDSLLFD